jgi:phosphohistidine phosphatase
MPSFIQVKLLCLLRHAKSSWADEELPDLERPLTGRGRKAAGRIAGYLAEHRVEPDLVLCSPALRTRQTLELVRPALPDSAEVAIEDGLYGAPAQDLLARLQRLPGSVETVLLIGHNPGIQELAARLAPPGERRRLDHFPTAALALLALPAGDWSDLDHRPARLVAVVIPRELG